MDQVKNTTVRFGITDPKDFAESGQAGDWRRIDVTFPAPFGVPKPGFPKGVPQEISVVVTPLEMRVAPVAVVKKVTNTGFTLWARNAMNKRGESRFAWLAVLGVPDSTEARKIIDARLGVLQTKVLAPPQKITEWPGVWFSDALVGTNRVVLLTAHNNTGPSNWGVQWNNAAAVASVYPMWGAPTTILPDDGFTAAAINVDTDGRSGYYYAAFIEARRHAELTADDLFIDHGSEKGVEDSFRYNQVTWPTPPNRGLKPGGNSGDWLYLDVYFDRPFLTPPVVLITARDNDADVNRHFNPLIAIAQNVSTHGFTAALRNTDSINATAEFYWIAIGCQAGCG
jgi:H-type lectin domain